MVELRRGLKGLIEPGEQIAVDEQLLAQQGGEIGQAPAKAGAQLQVLEQEQGNERGPDLNLQSVGAGADERLDAQVLFERLEEQFDLPALAVDGGDGGGGKAAMIGEKHQGALLRFVPNLDTAQEQIALAAAGQLVQEDDFIALDGAALRPGAAFHNAVIGIVLHARDEVDAVGIERGEPGVVGIATVEDHDGAGIETQRAGDAAFMHAAFGDEGETGQQALMIEQQMQLHGALGAPILCPVEDAGAEFDQGGVQAQQFVLEAEAMRAGSFVAAAQQLIKHGTVQLPRPMLIGIGQGGALGRIGQPQVPQLAFAGGQSAANLAQGLRPPQVTEQHGQELAPATEPASVALGPVLGDRLLELLAGKQLQHLAENAGYSYHGGGGPPYDSRLATQTVAEFYPRRSKPNLDKSDYKQIFSHTCKPEVFGHTIQLMKKVDDFVVARVEAKTDRANLKYYLALDAICSVAKRSTIQRGTIAKLKADKLTQEVLEGSLSRVQRIYEHIRARGVVPDLVAKGGEFVFELKRQLDERFPPKHKKTENLLWSAMEQEQ